MGKYKEYLQLPRQIAYEILANGRSTRYAFIRISEIRLRAWFISIYGILPDAAFNNSAFLDHRFWF